MRSRAFSFALAGNGVISGNFLVRLSFGGGKKAQKLSLVVTKIQGRFAQLEGMGFDLGLCLALHARGEQKGHEEYDDQSKIEIICGVDIVIAFFARAIGRYRFK